ncbi:MAG: hypothetical protein KF763_02275 [Cyclobacteriaceae bacterium]|nr:hypothetical protein [Cyclobacteriaceae bacterium]
MSRFLVWIALLIGCNSTQPKTTTDALQLAEVILGKGLEQFSNQSQTHTLFIQRTLAYPNQPIQFIVIEKHTGKIVFQKSFRPGYVKWRDDRTIEYDDQPGIVKQNEINTLKTWTIPTATPSH